MKAKRSIAISLLAVALLNGGCASWFYKKSAPEAAVGEPRPVSASPQTLPASIVAVSASQQDRAIAAGVAATPAPAGYMAPNQQPIYRSPTVAKIILAPYKGKDGKLYGPREVYQVSDEGGWNPEALEPGASSYIPAVNIETPGNVGNRIVAPARKSPPLPTESQHLIDHIDPNQVIITGLIDKGQQSAADSMAEEKRMQAVWDDQLGYILISKSAAQKLDSN